MRGLHLPALNSKSASLVNYCLSDVDGVAAALAEAEGDGNAVLSGCIKDLLHLWTIDAESILDVFDPQVEVDWSTPVCPSERFQRVSAALSTISMQDILVSSTRETQLALPLLPQPLR